MSKNVAARARQASTPAPSPRLGPAAYSPSIYTVGGLRKYLNAEERSRFLAMTCDLTRDQALFALTLAWTGARPSELVRGVTAASFQIEPGILAIRTLKRRRHAVREVPLPRDLMNALDAHFALRAAQRDPISALDPLWPFCRQTAWRIIKRLMGAAGISGAAACPRGLRHSFGVGTLQAGVPLNATQKWLGHSKVSSTAIYADCCGPEEVALATRWWDPASRDAASPARSFWSGLS